MDLFSVEEYFAEIGMLPTDPYSSKFEEVGFETKNFLINSGSFFIFFWLSIFEYAGRKLIVFICVRSAKFRVCRRLGMMADNPTLGASLIRLMMQTYIDIFICSVL